MELYCEDKKIAYYASADGKIFSFHKGTGRWFELKFWENRHGYLCFACCQNGMRKHIYVHRAVWQAFHGKIPGGYEINHKNCIRDDNRDSNLELVTRLQNNRHPPTREHAREAKRQQMRPVLDVTTGVVYESTMEAARQTGLRQGNISNCCNGRISQTGGHTFKFLEEEAA